MHARDALEARLRRDADAIRRAAQPGATFHHRIMARLATSAPASAMPLASWQPAEVLLAVMLVVVGVGVFLLAHHLAPTPATHSPAGGTIVFGRVINAKGDEDLFTIRADGTGEKRLLSCPVGCGASWSHKGDRLLLAAPGSIQRNLITTATVKADGSGYTVLPLDSPGLNLGPGAWSPDDRRIAFEGWDDGNPSRNGIYTADATDGGNLRRLTTNAEQTHDIPVSYSPDGSKILFWRGPGDVAQPGQLFLVGVDGGDPTLVSPSGMTVRIGNGDPGGWSPDGTQISFAAHSPTASDPYRSAVFVAAGDGTNPKRISEWGDATTAARWSPEGDWIVFDKVDAAAGAHSFFLIHPDGSGTKVISSVAGAGVCCAVWSPDGNRLLFSRGPSNNTHDLWIVQFDGSHLTQLTHRPANLADIGWSEPR